MNTVQMNAEAALCFREACQSEAPADRAMFLGMRQAWLALADQAVAIAAKRVQSQRPDGKQTQDRKKAPRSPTKAAPERRPHQRSRKRAA